MYIQEVLRGVPYPEVHDYGSQKNKSVVLVSSRPCLSLDRQRPSAEAQRQVPPRSFSFYLHETSAHAENQKFGSQA